MVERLVSLPDWNKNTKPENEDIWCVIWFENDYRFAYWVEGTGCWDCPSHGWIEDSKVFGWVALPNEPVAN